MQPRIRNQLSQFSIHQPNREKELMERLAANMLDFSMTLSLPDSLCKTGSAHIQLKYIPHPLWN
uniref:Uncharacterized protein n=1 Tax=Arion vulgaris TaxID=1028688 RepID=A0A0B7BR38_9EUPU